MLVLSPDVVAVITLIYNSIVDVGAISSFSFFRPVLVSARRSGTPSTLSGWSSGHGDKF